MNIYFLIIYQVIVFLIFFIIYLLTMINIPINWNGLEEENEKHILLKRIIDSFYFTICTQSSLGYGDITPKSRLIKMITSLHMLSTFVSIFMLVENK